MNSENPYRQQPKSSRNDHLNLEEMRCSYSPDPLYADATSSMLKSDDSLQRYEGL